MSSPLIATLIVAAIIVQNNDFFSVTMLWPSVLKQYLVWSLILAVVCRRVKARQLRPLANESAA